MMNSLVWPETVDGPAVGGAGRRVGIPELGLEQKTLETRNISSAPRALESGTDSWGFKAAEVRLLGGVVA